MRLPTAEHNANRPCAATIRGRTSFDLRPVGALVKRVVAANDRRQVSEGNWKLEDGDRLALYAGGQTKPYEVKQIASVSKDKLVIRK